MGLWSSLQGAILSELTCADPSALLTEFNKYGITLSRVMYTGDLTVQFLLSRGDFAKAQKIVSKKGGQMTVLRRQGIYWAVRSMYRRPVLMFGLLLFFVLSFYIPTRVFFIEVEGNTLVPTRKILEQAEHCGISFGASRREIRSEKMKNALLSAIPELQWAGVNTNGCVATITLRERTESEKTETVKIPGSIVASRDAVVRSCTVINGTQVCKIGQAVKAGEILVSGYTDCGIALKFTRAEAEVYGETVHSVDAVTLASALQRGQIQKKTVRYSLLLGKNRINFYKDSGISDTTCVKMYSQKYLTLPGGFQLPVCLVTETILCYDTDISIAADAEDYAWMGRYTQKYLERQMVAGTILQANEALSLEPGLCSFSGQYSCLEVIGQVKNEEIVQKDEQDHRKNG